MSSASVRLALFNSLYWSAVTFFVILATSVPVSALVVTWPAKTDSTVLKKELFPEEISPTIQSTIQPTWGDLTNQENIDVLDSCFSDYSMGLDLIHQLFFCLQSQVIEADEGCSYLFRPGINLFHFPPRNFQNLRRQPIFFPQRRRARSRWVAGRLAAVIWHFNYSWVFFCWSIENLWRFEILHLGLLFPAILLLCTALCFRHLGWSTVSDCGFFARKITPYPTALQFLGIYWRNERAHLSCHGWASRDVYFKGTQILFLFSSI